MSFVPADPLAVLVQTLWLMVPAYVPNSAAVLTAGWGPMDRGRKMSDGERILGDGKTWRGFLGGSAIGVIVGLAQQGIASAVPGNSFIVPFDANLPLAFVIIVVLAFGGMTGDSVGSLIKRRLRIPSGANAALLDQLAFALVAWWFIAVMFTGWFIGHFGNIVSILAVLLITPGLHRGVNIIGYKMGKKKVPW
ncbi:MAG TPA: CDP-2,3-bis-(O-geranylgeranyl)-sn-glycerol synthase [Thermoplasmata archaeon]|nr:CDP-2,3-bis-(O-geranylgeranyl)-sn-glycerol synthase [Thermoplasmata archaeon]